GVSRKEHGESMPRFSLTAKRQQTPLAKTVLTLVMGKKAAKLRRPRSGESSVKAENAGGNTAPYRPPLLNPYGSWVATIRTLQFRILTGGKLGLGCFVLVFAALLSHKRQSTL